MKKILLVEDDALIIKMYQKKLTSAGFEVSAAHGGEEGFIKMKSWKPDLVLLDIIMPKMNGIQFLEKAKADSAIADIPIVALTNLSGTADVELAIKKGAHSYMVKSDLTPAEVVDKIKKILPLKKYG